ncbi:MAG: hypothetical protein WCE70_10745 [Rhodanobacteraceae bacterium]
MSLHFQCNVRCWWRDHDAEALAASRELAHKNTIPALESAHALAHAKELAASVPSGAHFPVNLSGRGDKDLAHVMEASGAER